jgi:hypothetical protein
MGPETRGLYRAYAGFEKARGRDLKVEILFRHFWVSSAKLRLAS